MVEAEVATRTGDTSARTEARTLLSRRIALGAFVAYIAGAGVWLIVTFGPRMWFKGDEWGFIVGRSLADPVGWFAPQNTHWSTVPIVIYQVLFKLFGLNSYLPYVGVVIVAHLALAGLLRVVMRRAGAGPWVSTIVAGSFVLFGTGYWNILFGVQISMVLTMVCGIGHLLLADHDGPFDRRDAAGIAVGAIGLMSSGVGIPMLAVVGVGILVRRGWRLAFVHLAPLAALLVLWNLWQRPLDQGSTGVLDNLGAVAAFVGTGLTGIPLALGQHPIVAVLLAATLVVGLVLAWSPLDLETFRRTAAVPAALLVGPLLLQLSAGSQRYLLGSETARASHYVSMGTAMVLPALAVALSAVIGRWRAAAPLALLVLVGVPGNIGAFLPGADEPRWLEYQNQRDLVVGAAASPLADQVRPDVRPNPGRSGADEVTTGFLVAAEATGKVPDAPDLSVKAQQRIATRLALSQGAAGTTLPGAVCTAQAGPVVVAPQVGDHFAFTGRISVASAAGPDAPFGVATTYNAAGGGELLTAELPGWRFQIASPTPGQPIRWCTEP